MRKTPSALSKLSLSSYQGSRECCLSGLLSSFQPEIRCGGVAIPVGFCGAVISVTCPACASGWVTSFSKPPSSSGMEMIVAVLWRVYWGVRDVHMAQRAALCAWHTVNNQILALFISLKLKLNRSSPSSRKAGYLPSFPAHQCHCYRLSWDFCTILDLPIPFKSCSGQLPSFIDISSEMSLEFLCSIPLNPAAFETSFLGLIVFSLTFGPLFKTIFSAYYLIIHSLRDTFGEWCIESLLC